jgi:hypothetical protein
MRRNEDLTLTRRNSQTEFIAVQDGDAAPEWLDLETITPNDIVWQLAEGSVDANFSEADVVYEAPPETISILTWGETDAVWPERFESDEEGVEYEIAPPPDGTFIIRVELSADVTGDLLAAPTVETGGRRSELVRECKILSPDDFALQRTAITVLQGDVTVLPSTDDGTGQA